MVKLGIRVSDFTDKVATATLFIKNGNPEEISKSFVRLSGEAFQEFVVNKCDYGVWAAKGEAPQWWKQIF